MCVCVCVWGGGGRGCHMMLTKHRPVRIYKVKNDEKLLTCTTRTDDTLSPMCGIVHVQ